MVIDTSIDGDDDEADYHNSDSDSDDDANTFNENWDEAGDSKMVITNIQSQMRKLARSPKRKSGISSPSLATLLDAVRTDVDDTTFAYTNGQLTTVTRDGIVKTFTYNVDGTLNTATTVTNAKTIVRTFSYGSNGLASITVT